MRLPLATFLLLLVSASAHGADPQVVVKLQKNGEAFVVDARLDIPVSKRTAWGVLTDFDHMAEILNNLTSSKVIRRTGNTLNVVQEGTAHFGVFSYSFASEREIWLEPMTRIVARQITGTARRFSSETGLSPTERGIELRYHAEIVPDSGIARTFGGPFIEHEVEEQLSAMAVEMIRRQTP